MNNVTKFLLSPDKRNWLIAVEAVKNGYGFIDYDELVTRLKNHVEGDDNRVKYDYIRVFIKDFLADKDKIFCVKFAVFCARLVLHIFEDKYSNNNNPKKAIEAAIALVNYPTKENADAADAASSSAYAASSSAYAASAYAAYADAAYAAYAASFASVAAYYDAAYYYDAAASAASSAASAAASADSSALPKILKYLVEVE